MKVIIQQQKSMPLTCHNVIDIFGMYQITAFNKVDQALVTKRN